jgi:hypothetical protein
MDWDFLLMLSIAVIAYTGLVGFVQLSRRKYIEGSLWLAVALVVIGYWVMELQERMQTWDWR